MTKSNDRLWFLAALIPACISFGPLFLSNQWGSWLLTAGLINMFLYITQLHKRITALEEDLQRQSYNNLADWVKK
jgi:hypothetical protein